MTPVLESPNEEAIETNGVETPIRTKGRHARKRRAETISEENNLPKEADPSREAPEIADELQTFGLEAVTDERSVEGAAAEPSGKITTSIAILKSRVRTTEGGPTWPLLLVPVEAVGPNPFQPREIFDEEELEELAASIKEHGVHTPIIVRTAKPAVIELEEDAATSNGSNGTTALAKAIFVFELIAGERRLRASRLAKVKAIPVIVRDDLNDAQVAEMALVENVQRSNLNIIEEGRGYKRLMLQFRFTEKRISKKVGKSVPTIQAAIKLLELPVEVQTLLLKKQLTAAHGHELLRLAAYPEICVSVALRAQAEKLTAAALSQNVLPNSQQLKRRGQVVELGYATKFAWRTECQNCPFKAFVSGGHAAYCLRPDEWRRKQDHAIEMAKQEAARILEAARGENEVTVGAADLPHGSYCNLQWNEPPAGCTPSCECRGRIADPHDAAKSIPICLNPERLKELQREQRLAQEAERKRHYARLASAAVAGIASLPEEAASPVVATFHTIAADAQNAESDHELAPLKDSLPEQVESEEPVRDDMSKGAESEKVESEEAALPVNAASPEQDSGDMISRRWTLENLDLRKIAPILVLPALAGSHGNYYGDRNWEDMVERTAQELGIDLPVDEIMGQIDDAVPLRLLQAVDPLSLLLLGAAVLVRQEAEYAARWEGETPRLQFVLGLQRGEQREIELELPNGGNEDAVPDDSVSQTTGGETGETSEPKTVAGLMEEGNPEDIERSEDKPEEEPNLEEQNEAMTAPTEDAESALEGIERTDDDAIIAALEMEEEEEYADQY